MMQIFLSGAAAWESDKRRGKISRKPQVYMLLLCERAAAGTCLQEGKPQPMGKIGPAHLMRKEDPRPGLQAAGGGLPVVAMQSKPTKA